MAQPSYLILFAAHLLVSATVTIHVLLHKRNVQSAIGWIGLAWLTPFIGALLYFAFGINRVQRRALILRRASKKPGEKMLSNTSSTEPFGSLKTTIGALTQQNLMTANISMPLHDGDDAYPLMLAAINNAKRTIALTSYIFRSDRIGHEFIDALANAVNRGVLVRVLLDGFGSGIFLATSYRHFRKQGVPVAQFMNSILPWKMQFLNLRLHKKVLVIDCQTAFVGGLNIAAENTSRPRHKVIVRDTHFKMSGSVVEQITSDFINDWLFATGEQLDETIWISETREIGTVLSRVIVSGPDQDADKLSLVLLSAISTAQKSIKIATPYFLPDEGLITALQLAATRGVDVRIVIPLHSNHTPMDWAMNAHVGPLLLAGCRIWKAPLPFDHSKLMIVDNTWCLFGSPNWDTRSLRLNFEMAIEAYDPKLAAQLSFIIEQSSVTPLTLRDLEARSLFVKCRDAATRLLMPYL
ncbi:MAG: phospholipase D-like domain-containing protein [Pseudomonadota bacterium]|nr:phospholipase D-like domain-containing protein [Pseudomonadota bacterium]